MDVSGALAEALCRPDGIFNDREIENLEISCEDSYTIL